MGGWGAVIGTLNGNPSLQITTVKLEESNFLPW